MLADKRFYYDGSKDGLPAGQVFLGNVKRVVTVLDRSFASPVIDPTVRNEYGAFGNLTATVDPNGRRTVSDYRGSPFQLYPRVERNALGHTVTTVTDLRYGQPTAVTGPNGQVTAYRYDALGRVTCVAGPLDSIVGCRGGTPFTRSREFRYVYGNSRASGFQAKLSYVEERRREPWADGNAAAHSASDYVARPPLQRRPRPRPLPDAAARHRCQRGRAPVGGRGPEPLQPARPGVQGLRPLRPRCRERGGRSAGGSGLHPLRLPLQRRHAARPPRADPTR